MGTSIRTITIDEGPLRPLHPAVQWPVDRRDGSARFDMPAGTGATVAAGMAAGLAPGTRLATARGHVRVESLMPGDRVMTRDNGLVTLRDMRRCRVPAAAVVSLAPGALRGQDGQLRVGRGQGLLWSGRRVDEAIGTREAMVLPGDLDTGTAGGTGFVTLFLPVMDRQEMVFAEGAAVCTALPEGGVPSRRQLTKDEARRVLRD